MLNDLKQVLQKWSTIKYLHFQTFHLYQSFVTKKMAQNK